MARALPQRSSCVTWSGSPYEPSYNTWMPDWLLCSSADP